MKSVKKITLLVIAAAVLIGCIFAAGCTDDTPAPVLKISVDKQAGFTYGIGDEFTIVLPSNPSTGYQWVVTSANGLKSTENEVAPAEGAAVGAPTSQSFTFTALSEGTFPIILSYVKSGEDAGIYVYSDVIFVEKDAPKNSGKFVFDGTYVPMVGDTVEISVPDNSASTGFVWSVESSDPENFKLIDTKFIAPETDLIGAAGTTVWTFQAMQPGSYVVVAAQEKQLNEGTEMGVGFFVPVTIQANFAE